MAILVNLVNLVRTLNEQGLRATDIRGPTGIARSGYPEVSEGVQKCQF